uniref:Uncharacterized protein n=1 Tax=Ditylum brightwellii TaxID=49249 RepID=A0A7S4R6E1_9STRA
MQFMVNPGVQMLHHWWNGWYNRRKIRIACVPMSIPSHTTIPNSTIANCGSNTFKSSPVYYVSSLMTGSKDTLGVITSIAVKLHPIPAHVMAAICSFDTPYRMLQMQ